MKAKEGFKIREVCGEKIIVAEGLNNIDFSNIISMNESSAYLWEARISPAKTWLTYSQTDMK